MAQDYFSRKVTQSQYRGGRKAAEDEIVYLDLSLAPVEASKESVKEGVRTKIRNQSQSMVSHLLAESYHPQVRQTTYLKKLFTQLEL